MAHRRNRVCHAAVGAHHDVERPRLCGHGGAGRLRRPGRAEPIVELRRAGRRADSRERRRPRARAQPTNPRRGGHAARPDDGDRPTRVVAGRDRGTRRRDRLGRIVGVRWTAVGGRPSELRPARCQAGRQGGRRGQHHRPRPTGVARGRTAHRRGLVDGEGACGDGGDHGRGRCAWRSRPGHHGLRQRRRRAALERTRRGTTSGRRRHRTAAGRRRSAHGDRRPAAARRLHRLWPDDVVAHRPGPFCRRHDLHRRGQAGPRPL